MPVRDLSHLLADGMPTYPGDPAVAVSPHATHASAGYRVGRLAFGTHTGTHVDAPAHTEPDGATLDAFDVSRFRFDARVVTLDADANEAIGPGALPADPGTGVDLLLFETGWHRHWGTDRYADHPFLAPATAEWCADRGLDVAIDAFSVDPTPAETVPAHHALLGSGRLVVENLTNLDGLPERVTLHAYPLPVADGDGGPVRAVASWE
jgi:kynurenine formamidase